MVADMYLSHLWGEVLFIQMQTQLAGNSCGQIYFGVRNIRGEAMVADGHTQTNSATVNLEDRC